MSIPRSPSSPVGTNPAGTGARSPSRDEVLDAAVVFPRVAGPTSSWAEFGAAALVIAVITVLGLLLPVISHVSIGLIYLLGVIMLSLWVGRWPVLLAGILSALVWEYIFIPPRFAFAINTAEDALLFGTYFVVALVAGQLTARIREQYAHRLALLAEREQLREASERAERLASSEKLHRALFDSVSHELRTPLAVIDAAVDGLETQDAAGRAALIDEIRIAARRLNRLVHNLLDQTRLESGALKPRLDWCAIPDLVNSAVDGTRDALADHRVTLDIPDNLPPIRVDFALTEHALMNLVLNAAYHTAPGTSVTISAGVRDGRAYLEVADNGRGFPPEILGQPFEKFTRGAGARAGGLGLGLPIVRGLIHAQGGEVALGNSPAGGARVTLWLPEIGADDALANE